MNSRAKNHNKYETMRLKAHTQTAIRKIEQKRIETSIVGEELDDELYACFE